MFILAVRLFYLFFCCFSVQSFQIASQIAITSIMAFYQVDYAQTEKSNLSKFYCGRMSIAV